ncbi:hypothetical protein AB3456_08830 [Staphylococcus pseudoxylosus]|uniref:phage baseplate protein n=1 Tax=Staphylococcus pseudoxylosus TaxID=2282419 RepID=UPI0034D34F53
MLKLQKSLTSSLGQGFRQELHTNFLRTETFVNEFADKFRYHKLEEKEAHHSAQITDERFKTVERGLNIINKRYDNLVLSKGKNSLQEVKDARLDTLGTRHETLFDRLLSDSNRHEIDKEELTNTVEETRDQMLAQEFEFDIPNSSWQYLTNLSPMTNSVMQSFLIDETCDIAYQTQAYRENYKLTKMKANGQFLSQMEIDGGGHGTQIALRHDKVENKTWIYSNIKRPDGYRALVRFTYRPDITLGYGEYDMEEVYTGHPERPYMTPYINEHEGLIMLRIEYPKSEWESRQTANYVEIRRIEDIDNKVDKVLYSMDIPKHLTSFGDITQPMQGCAYDDGKLYWYTGDSNPEIPNFMTVFDLKNGKQLYQKEVDIGISGNEYPGDFAEAEGCQIYYDEETGKKALLVGVTVGAANYRAHEVHGIFMRGLFEKMKAPKTPISTYETGGRTKSFPVEHFNRMADLLEPGDYYMNTVDTMRVSDFPLPKEMRDGGWFLNNSAFNVQGVMKQTLTRNTFDRDIMQFTRLVSVNNFADTNGASSWCHVGLASIGGVAEAVPNHITNMNQLGIVANKEWYIDTATSSKLKDFPLPSVAGWTCYVDNVTSSRFRVTLTRVASTAPVEQIIAYFSSSGKPERISSWTQFKGTNL